MSKNAFDRQQMCFGRKIIKFLRKKVDAIILAHKIYKLKKEITVMVIKICIMIIMVLISWITRYAPNLFPPLNSPALWTGI